MCRFFNPREKPGTSFVVVTELKQYDISEILSSVHCCAVSTVDKAMPRHRTGYDRHVRIQHELCTASTEYVGLRYMITLCIYCCSSSVRVCVFTLTGSFLIPVGIQQKKCPCRFVGRINTAVERYVQIVWSQNYATEIRVLHCDAVGRKDNAMPCHSTGTRCTTYTKKNKKSKKNTREKKSNEKKERCEKKLSRPRAGDVANTYTSRTAHELAHLSCVAQASKTCADELPPIAQAGGR